MQFLYHTKQTPISINHSGSFPSPPKGGGREPSQDYHSSEANSELALLLVTGLVSFLGVTLNPLSPIGV